VASDGRIDQRIDRSYGELTPQEQRVADFILDHLGDLAVYNAAELARLSDVSKATVSRFFRRLGFASAAEVREHARSLRSEGSPVGGADATGDLAHHLAAEQENLRRVVATLEDGRLERAAHLVDAARRVVVIGFRNSYPLALHLREQLAQARDSVQLAPLPGQSVGEDLAGLGAADAVVLFGFRRRPAGFGALFSAIRDRGIPTILIGDSSVRRAAEHATVWLECPVDSPSPFDSYAAAMSTINLLATAVLAERSRDGRRRIATITGLYDAIGELEAPR
jgi:DNA-binding MurR/RpiR family transcriptional regulator